MPAQPAGLALSWKGDGHRIYANTFFNAHVNEMCLPSCVEKRKPFRVQYPLVRQNTNRTLVFNTACEKESGGGCECPNNSTVGGNQTAVLTNHSLQQLRLVDVSNFDFRPAPGSPLIDAGAVVPPYTDGGFVGEAPDIGAYEHGAERGVAGCEHDAGC